MMVNLLRFLPKIDIYTKVGLHPSVFTQEHIIPKRFFISKKHADDLLNLAPTHKYLNGLRSDLKYGNLKNKTNYDHLSTISKNKSIIAYIDRKKRIFYPTIIADKGLIARSLINMFYKYPYLYCYIDEIVDDPETIWRWSHDNPIPSLFEISRNNYLKRCDPSE